jgi:hypothetical protein
MKKIILGTFGTRGDAETLIKHLYIDLAIPKDDISYVYRNTEGEIFEMDSDEVAQEPAAKETAMGAMIGGTVGAIAGIATVAGIIPVIGPIFAAGPIIAAFGVGAGAVGLTAAGALTGAIVGGVIAAFMNLSSLRTETDAYDDEVLAGNVLVVTHARNDSEVGQAFKTYGASGVHIYTPSV